MKVAKFGGSSLASASQIKKVCEIVRMDDERKLIIVSAPGKRDKNDTKVTDLLIQCANKHLLDRNANVELSKIIVRFKEIIEELGIASEFIIKIENDLKNRLSGEIVNESKFMDLMKAAGEDLCAQVVAEYLKTLDIKASYINPKDAGLILSDEFGNARVLNESFDNLAKLKDKEGILIFPGFFGYSKTGEVVTFPRGGSDITGSILASAVDAKVYENFTDVDSVFAANPNVIDNPKPIYEFTYSEMRELSYAGFSVLHEETLEPVYRKGIPVNIRNTNNPSAKGTMILKERKSKNGPVVGIACDNGFCSLYVSKYMMNREIGFGRKLLSILEDEGISYEHIPSGIDNISIIFRENKFTKEIEKRVTSRIISELQVDDVTIERELALVMLVGEGMMQTIGVASRATTAFSKNSINIIMINQGSSEVSMMFGIKSIDGDKAIKALYDEFFM